MKKDQVDAYKGNSPNSIDGGNNKNKLVGEHCFSNASACLTLLFSKIKPSW
jgi:hypothetical protein